MQILDTEMTETLPNPTPLPKLPTSKMRVINVAETRVVSGGPEISIKPGGT